MIFIRSVFEKRPLRSGESPQSFFEHVRGKYSFLLESGRMVMKDQKSEFGGRGVGERYSYVGWDPFMVLYLEKGAVYLEKLKDFARWKKSPIRQILDGDAMKILRDIFSEFSYRGDFWFPFCGGAAGFITYDFGCALQNVEQGVFDDIALPDYCLMFVDKLVVVDHERGEVYLTAFAQTEVEALAKLAQIKEDLKRPLVIRGKGEIGKIESNLSAKVYREKIMKIKEYLRQGQTYQVNFSQRFSADSSLDGWAVFKALFKKSPAPFSCYFDYGDFEIVSASPELLLRKRKDHLETWPIKGTVARGANAREEARFVKRLLSSEKDEAELAMIVDLARNDLGRVCEAGSITVESHRELMKLSHVIHTFSRVSGKMARDKDVFDAIQSVFPGGSITGCPKKRTMEIIDKLEDFKRGIYTGSAGYISFSGDADLNILIRSILLKDNKIYFQAGGGIVIDSDAGKEYEESFNKARGILETLADG